jgi:hypothetical protein
LKQLAGEEEQFLKCQGEPNIDKLMPEKGKPVLWEGYHIY